MFRLPTPRLLSGLKSALRPAMPRFKVSAFWLLILAWGIIALMWLTVRVMKRLQQLEKCKSNSARKPLIRSAWN